MSTLVKIERLWVANNDAAKLITKGRYQDAYVLLRGATDQVAADPAKMMDADLTYDAFSTVGTIPLSAPSISSFDGDCVLHHDVFPLPFAVYPKGGNAIEDRIASLIAGTVVALFNMALVRHRQFFLCACPATRRHLLREACDIYLTIHQMLANIPLDPDDPIAQLYLVCCCNLIHVHGELGALERVQYWKGELHEAFACFSTEHPGGTYQFVQRVCAYGSVCTISAGAA